MFVSVGTGATDSAHATNIIVSRVFCLLAGMTGAYCQPATRLANCKAIILRVPSPCCLPTRAHQPRQVCAYGNHVATTARRAASNV